MKLDLVLADDLLDVKDGLIGGTDFTHHKRFPSYSIYKSERNSLIKKENLRDSVPPSGRTGKEQERREGADTHG